MDISFLKKTIPIQMIYTIFTIFICTLLWKIFVFQTKEYTSFYISKRLTFRRYLFFFYIPSYIYVSIKPASFYLNIPFIFWTVRKNNGELLKFGNCKRDIHIRFPYNVISSDWRLSIKISYDIKDRNKLLSYLNRKKIVDILKKKGFHIFLCELYEKAILKKDISFLDNFFANQSVLNRKKINREITHALKDACTFTDLGIETSLVVEEISLVTNLIDEDRLKQLHVMTKLIFSDEEEEERKYKREERKQLLQDVASMFSGSDKIPIGFQLTLKET